MSKFSFEPKQLKAGVLGANDGIITTFAVVAGVVGAGLSVNTIVILGVANMIADGLSMALGDYLGEKSVDTFEKNVRNKEESEVVWKTGVITFVAFVAAGVLPLLPYLLATLGVPIPESSWFIASIISTAIALFSIGVLRTVFTAGKWWFNGLEMLGVGAIAAIVAYGLGALIGMFVGETL